MRTRAAVLACLVTATHAAGHVTMRAAVLACLITATHAAGRVGLARVGKAGRRGDSKSINRTIMRIERDSAAAACRALAIELRSYPDKEDFTSTRNGDLKAAKQSWYAKCPLEFIVDIANVHDPDQHVYGAFVTERQVTVCLKATKRVTQRQRRGQGVTSQRLNLEVSEEQSRQVTTVLAALRLKPKRPPVWMRITVT